MDLTYLYNSLLNVMSRFFHKYKEIRPSRQEVINPVSSYCISYRHIIGITRLIAAYASIVYFLITWNTQYKLSTSLVYKWTKLNDLHHVMYNSFISTLQLLYTVHASYIIHIAFHFTQRSCRIS